MTPTSLAKLLQAFFTEYLPMQRNVSPHTVRSYRDLMTLLLRFCRDRKGLAIERLRIEEVSAELVIEFLDSLETDRGCSIRTRNQRLAALHAFVRYLQVEAPEHMLHCQRLLAIPFKRYDRPTLHYLSAEQMRAILSQPNLGTPIGRRDLALLSVLYDTGARVQEVIDLTMRDVRLDAPAQLHLTGKGGKTRVVPLMPNTVALLADHVREHVLDQLNHLDTLLFANRHRQRFTRTGIRRIIQKYVTLARSSCPHLPEQISPHTFRHSKAMHLLQAGIPLVIIRDFLGHADVTTTEIYARADLDMKRRALEKIETPVAPYSLPSWHDDSELLTWLRAL
jgi:site-specific recombinase XerD